MNKITKNSIKSPLLGATFLTLLSIVYLSIFTITYDLKNIIEIMLGIMKVIPVLFICFALISYALSIPIGFLLYREMQNNLRTEKFFVNMSLFIGFILSIITAMLDYHYHQSIAKSFFIVIGISLMGIINANYFLILSEIIIIKEKKNEIKKGIRI